MLPKVSKSKQQTLSFSSLASLPWMSNQPTPTPPPQEHPYKNEPSKYITHQTAITLIHQEKDPQRALQIFNKLSSQKGFNHNTQTYSAILNKLARSKKLNAVDQILKHMKHYDTCKFQEHVFIDLMKWFSKWGLHARVVDMFCEIESVVREKPTLKAVSTCVNLLVEANEIELVKRVLLYAKRSFGFWPNACVFNILVKYHCRNGDMESAVEVVEEMRSGAGVKEKARPNLITYSTLIDGFCRCGRLKDAMDVFEEMVEKDGVLPDVLTYNLLIDGFCKGGRVDKGRKVMEFMKGNGGCPNIFNYSALMNGYVKEGRVEEAKAVFDEMRSFGMKVDTVGYTTLINCFCRAGRVDDALGLLREMKERECKADIVTFNVILGGLCREGRLDEAIGMVERLPYEGVYLNKASYRILLNFLCKEGDLEKAKEFLGLMITRGFLPHFATSNELLVSFCKAGMADDAAAALFGLVEMGFKPEHNSWIFLVELVCRERKLLPAFELMDDLLVTERDHFSTAMSSTNL